MKSRKKKNTSQQEKQDFRHNLNVYYKKIKQTMPLVGDVSAFKLLNKTDQILFHHCRIRPYKIINGGNLQNKVCDNDLRFINQYLSDILHNTFVELDGNKISIYDFSINIENLFLMWRNIREEIKHEFRACFTVFASEKFNLLREEVLERVEQKLELMAWLYSDLTFKTIRFTKEKIKTGHSLADQSVYFNNYHIEPKKVETEMLQLEGNNRKVYRLRLNLKQEFLPLEIMPERLGISGLMQKFPLKVFIQQHAIDRIKQRLGVWFWFLGYAIVVSSMLVDPIEQERGRSYLFAVKHGKVTLGYLKSDLIGDKLVIRTFLFITNNGTPEGKKLNDLFGIEKADKKYLGIDKLSTFINSDIKKDDKLKELFSKAGCGDLFQLDKSLLDNPESKEIACAGFLNHYLGRS